MLGVLFDIIFPWEAVIRFLVSVFPWVLMYVLLCLFISWRKKAGEAYGVAAKYAPTDEMRVVYSRKSVLAGNKEARYIYAIMHPDSFTNYHPHEIFKIGKISCVFAGFYFASRYKGLLGKKQDDFIKRVLDFKDGKEDGMDFFKDGIERLKPEKGTIIMFMPCSAWWKYWTRFRKIADYITSECPNLENGFYYYRYMGERESLHLQKNRFDVTIETNFEIIQDLTGKNIIVVDDVITTGKSLKAFKKDVEAKGGRVVGAIFFAHTFSMPGYINAFFTAWSDGIQPSKQYQGSQGMETAFPEQRQIEEVYTDNDILEISKKNPIQYFQPDNHSDELKNKEKLLCEPDRILFYDDSSMAYCYQHFRKGRKPYYTAVHIPANKKEARSILDHLAEIIEADKHRDPTDYELTINDHPYYN